jgi:hypothetical protein
MTDKEIAQSRREHARLRVAIRRLVRYNAPAGTRPKD